MLSLKYKCASYQALQQSAYITPLNDTADGVVITPLKDVIGTFQKTGDQIVAATQKKFVFIFGIHKPKHIQILVIK